MNKYTKRNKKTKIWQVAATEIEEPKKRNRIFKSQKELEEKEQKKDRRLKKNKNQ